jgi:hypothetical protein
MNSLAEIWLHAEIPGVGKQILHVTELNVHFMVHLLTLRITVLFIDTLYIKCI